MLSLTTSGLLIEIGRVIDIPPKKNKNFRVVFVPFAGVSNETPNFDVNSNIGNE